MIIVYDIVLYMLSRPINIGFNSFSEANCYEVYVPLLLKLSIILKYYKIRKLFLALYAFYTLYLFTLINLISIQ